MEIQRALLTKSNSESLNPNGKKSFKSVNQRSLSLWREKSVGNKSNSDAKKSVEIQRALLTKSNSESSNPNGKKSFKSVLSVGNINSAWHAKRNSVGSVNQRSLSPWRENSVRDKKNSVRDKENAEASPASKSVESVERFSRSERANKSSPPELGGVPEPTVLSQRRKKVCLYSAKIHRRCSEAYVKKIKFCPYVILSKKITLCVQFQLPN